MIEQGVTAVDKRGINREWLGSHSLTASANNFCDVKNLTITVDDSGKVNLSYKNDFVAESVDYSKNQFFCSFF